MNDLNHDVALCTRWADVASCLRAAKCSQVQVTFEGEHLNARFGIASWLRWDGTSLDWLEQGTIPAWGWVSVFPQIQPAGRRSLDRLGVWARRQAQVHTATTQVVYESRDLTWSEVISRFCEYLLNAHQEGWNYGYGSSGKMIVSPHCVVIHYDEPVDGLPGIGVIRRPRTDAEELLDRLEEDELRRQHENTV